MGQQEIEAYLNKMAGKRRVSVSIQSAALNAIAFLYREVLKMDMPCLVKLRRIKRYQTIPVVISVQEVQATFGRMHGAPRLMAELIYGTGLRVGECVKKYLSASRSFGWQFICPSIVVDLGVIPITKYAGTHHLRRYEKLFNKPLGTRTLPSMLAAYYAP
jgi:integrase